MVVYVAARPSETREHLTSEQWFPTFFHLPTPWQPIYINCTLHINKVFVINIVGVISSLSCLTLLIYVHFPAIIQFFSRPLNVLVCIPGGTLTPGWGSLLWCDVGEGGSVHFIDAVIW